MINKVDGNTRLPEDHLILPKLKAIKIKQHRIVPDDYRRKSVTVSL
ncbi:hypothetical protein JR334_07275 [Clostridia bacterium]|nr:hypothetical protein JR334_07275 [Clostridia bacterium]